MSEFTDAEKLAWAAYEPREYIRPDPRPGSTVLLGHFR